MTHGIRSLSWRAPSTWGNIGIAMMIMAVCCVIVFAAIGFSLEHTPRTEDVPLYGIVGGLVFALPGLLMFLTVPTLTADFERGELRRGDQRIANLARTQALLLQEFVQRIPLQSGGTTEVRGWELSLIQADPADEPWQGQVDPPHASAMGDDAEEDVEVIKLLHGVRRKRAESMARRFAIELDRPILVLDVAGELSTLH